MKETGSFYVGLILNGILLMGFCDCVVVVLGF